MSNKAEDAEYERRSEEHNAIVSQASALDRIADALKRIADLYEYEMGLSENEEDDDEDDEEETAGFFRPVEGSENAK